jgi:hypothetical protein
MSAIVYDNRTSQEFSANKQSLERGKIVLDERSNNNISVLDSDRSRSSSSLNANNLSII